MSNAAEFSTCSCPSLTLDYKNLMGASIILNNLSLISSLYIKHVMAQTIFEVLLPFFYLFSFLLYPSLPLQLFSFAYQYLVFFLLAYKCKYNDIGFAIAPCNCGRGFKFCKYI